MLELDLKHLQLRPLALEPELHVTNQGLKRRFADVIGELVVIESFRRQRDAERVDVAPGIDRTIHSSGLFRCHVGGEVRATGAPAEGATRYQGPLARFGPSGIRAVPEFRVIAPAVRRVESQSTRRSDGRSRWPRSSAHRQSPLRSASARFAWGRRTCNGALRSCPAPQELFAAQPSVRARAQSCRGYDAAQDPDRHREHRPDDRPWRSGSRGGRYRSDQQVPQAPWHSPPRHSPPS